MAPKFLSSLKTFILRQDPKGNSNAAKMNLLNFLQNCFLSRVALSQQLRELCIWLTRWTIKWIILFLSNNVSLMTFDFIPEVFLCYLLLSISKVSTIVVQAIILFFWLVNCSLLSHWFSKLHILHRKYRKIFLTWRSYYSPSLKKS